MKLLLDENLSRRIVPALQSGFPGSSQVALLGLERANDRTIWDFAKSNGYVIVTGDADFEEMSLILGAPPHVVRVRGNLSNTRVLALLTQNVNSIRASIEGEKRACVEVLDSD